MDHLPNSPRAAISLIEGFQDGEEHYLLIERASNPKDFWSGHLSFPGGKLEEGETPLEAAIRETKEEVGIYLSNEEKIAEQEIGFAGRKGVFGMYVKPYVFKIPNCPSTQLDPKEIANAFWVAKSHLNNQAYFTMQAMIPEEPEHLLPCLEINHKVLWGYSLKVLMQHLNLPISRFKKDNNGSQ